MSAAPARGFTLIELLAVLVILGIAMGIAATALGGVRGAHAALLAGDALRSGLQRARVLAQRGSGCALLLDTEAVRARSASLDLEIIAPLPPGWSLSARDALGDPVSGPIEIDRDGIGIDLDLELTSMRGERVRIAALGISGQCRLLKPDERAAGSQP